MSTLTVADIRVFQEEILSWYTIHKRDLPWRRDRDPYHILVSELMLQQTQVSRVIPKYEAWLHELPTIHALAKTETRVVLKLWSGLGYNRRALYLKGAAQLLVNEYKGVWPEEASELEKLPGIGKYTAAAIACFAFDKQLAVVDTNVRRVILVNFGIELQGREVEELAKKLVPAGRAYIWNQALMDYSSVVLKKEKIPVPKQTALFGSDRYVRGQVIKMLLQKSPQTEEVFLKHFISLHAEYTEERVLRILEGLIREGFVKKDGENFFIS